MSKYILCIITMYSISVKAETKPIYEQIVRNHPDIDRQYAENLSKIIYKLSAEFKINPHRLTAILAQESLYRLNTVNKASKDYGIAQINHRTIERYGFNKERLLTDLEYSVKAGAIVLADFKRMYGKKEPDFWTRYNSSNPEKRQKYEQLVIKYL